MDESGFGGDDFISFDFGQEAGPSSPRPSTSARSNDRGPSGSRKRKADAERSLNAPETVSIKKERERAAARGTPWTVDVNWDTARNPAQQLNREIIAFERWLSPTTAEHECRRMVIALIRKAICSQWRGAEVHSFGSQDTQLYLPQGDIDLVVVCPAMEVQRREGVLRSMAACLRRNNLAGDVQVIAKAKVPIIKFVCTYGKYRCDISVNQTNGLAAADYVNDMQRDMPVIRPLVLLVKHLLQQRGMSEVYTGGLGSFSVILMVINFCQIHPKIQRGEIDPCRNLGVLFLEFLELYGKNFSYDDTGISVLRGGGYFSKAHRGWVDTTKPYKLAIEDPQSVDNDISKGSYSILGVRSALSGAFDILTGVVCQRGMDLARGRGRGAGGRGSHLRFGGHSEDEDEDEGARRALRDGRGAATDKDPRSLLGSIIGVSRDLVKSRRDIQQLYDSDVLQAKLGRRPPKMSPSPGPSRVSSQRPPEPDYPPPSRASSPPPPPPPTVPRNNSRGSGVQSVIDVERQPPQHSTPQRSRPRSFRDNDSQDDDDDDDDDFEDSRYASSTKRARREHSVHERGRYVSEESESQSDGGAASEDGQIVEGKGDRQQGRQSRESSRGRPTNDLNNRRRDYWLGKSFSSRDNDSD